MIVAKPGVELEFDFLGFAPPFGVRHAETSVIWVSFIPQAFYQRLVATGRSARTAADRLPKYAASFTS